LGEFYESKGRKKEAIDRYAEAYDISPLDRIRSRIRGLAKEFSDNLAQPESETIGVGVASSETMKGIVEILIRINDHDTALQILQQLSNAGMSEPWVIRNMAECFNALFIEDMAIKYYRRYLDQIRKEKTVSTTMDNEEKLIVYQLAKVFERKGLSDLALKEFQSIYEQDIQYQDIALKIPVLYEKKMQEEKLLEEKSKQIPFSKKISKPNKGEIRCPKCLNVIVEDSVYCRFCNCKVGFTEEELKDQKSKREARIASTEKLELPPGEGASD